MPVVTQWAVMTRSIVYPIMFVNLDESRRNQDVDRLKKDLCANTVARDISQKFAWKDILLIMVYEELVYSNNDKIFHLKISIQTGADGSLLHKCECCPIYFKTAEERDVHTAAEHNETFVCEFCEKSFRSLKSLQWHNYLSHKDRVEKINIAKVAEFKCKYCDKKYLEKKGLDIHTAEHGK